jgi:hypothetical protein
LPRGFEIKMSGGEPFAHPAFLGRIIPGLIEETSHRISVLTNLSASPAQLEQFARLTSGRLEIVSASLHLEHVTVESFLTRALLLRSRLDPGTRLTVNSVLVPGRLEALQPAVDAVIASGLPFFPQIMKTKRGIASYSDREKPWLDRFLGESPSPRQANLSPSYRGRRCWTGVDYFVVTQTGDAWSCRTARRHQVGFLGNVLSGEFQVALQPRICPWDICPCTVPANRGMIEGIGAAGETG